MPRRCLRHFREPGHVCKGRNGSFGASYMVFCAYIACSLLFSYLRSAIISVGNVSGHSYVSSKIHGAQTTFRKFCILGFHYPKPSTRISSRHTSPAALKLQTCDLWDLPCTFRQVSRMGKKVEFSTFLSPQPYIRLALPLDKGRLLSSNFGRSVLGTFLARSDNQRARGRTFIFDCF